MQARNFECNILICTISLTQWHRMYTNKHLKADIHDTLTILNFDTQIQCWTSLTQIHQTDIMFWLVYIFVSLVSFLFVDYITHRSNNCDL